MGGSLNSDGCYEQFRKLISSLHMKDWVVYLKKPLAEPAKAISYLKTLHQVAIPDGRIKKSKKNVFFSYRNRKDRNPIKESTLSSHEFTRRFLLHVLPSCFTCIRHFEFLAIRDRAKNKAYARGLFDLPQVKFRPERPMELMLRLAGIDITLYPRSSQGCS
ncbi:MAG: transposase [Actinomycetota bacterium]